MQVPCCVQMSHCHAQASYAPKKPCTLGSTCKEGSQAIATAWDVQGGENHVDVQGGEEKVQSKSGGPAALGMMGQVRMYTP